MNCDTCSAEVGALDSVQCAGRYRVPEGDGDKRHQEIPDWFWSVVALLVSGIVIGLVFLYNTHTLRW